MTNEQKKWIDEASYEDLLSKWRFAPAGDPFFQGDTGAYYSTVMHRKREEDIGAAVEVSKKIGWD